MMTELAALARPKLAERFHHEAFGVEDMGQEAAYRVELARSGAVVDVPPGQTMLHALRQNGVEIDASCEGGVCLECKTRFLEGTPIHRDLAMKPEDRAEYITPCVSGCAGERIVLDL
jgi:ferredoxin